MPEVQSEQGRIKSGELDMSYGHKGEVCKRERNRRDRLVQKGILPVKVYTDDIDTAWEKAGLLHII